MAVDPNPSIWNSDDSQEVSAINYGLGDAGTYLLLETGTEYHVWNDKGMVKSSSKMICVRVSARDDNGDEIKNITKQHWPEIKSLTIHEGANGGDASGETDDNMTEFQPVGLNTPLIIGNIPADCYRKIMVRVHIPNSGIEGPVTFQIYVLNQEPSTPIAKWITGLHGNGVVYKPGGAFAVSIGTPASNLDIEKGLALIDSLEAYYGAAQQYSVAALENGTYKLYLTSVGVISAIIDTSSIPANSIELNRVVVAGGVATAVTDKRLFLTNIMVGLDEAKTATPTKNQVYIATDTERIYICFADDTWSQVIPYLNMVTKTGDFTAGRIVKINNASGIVEQGTNTDTDVATAVAHSGLTNNPHAVTKAQISLTNVTDDAQLKRAAGDINTFDEKTEPIADDLLLAEDSADSNNKKKVKMKYFLGGLINQVLTSGTAISWDMKDGSRATLTAAHNFTIIITKFTAVLMAILIVTQDGTGNRVMDEIITQKDEDIGTAEVHADTDIIDLSIDIPTGARIRFKTSVADLPDPLVVDTIYYAIRISATEIKVATSKVDAFAGTAIDILDVGTGTHEVQQLVKWPGGTLGILQVAAGGEDIIKLHYKPSDEQWYAELVSNFS